MEQGSSQDNSSPPREVQGETSSIVQSDGGPLAALMLPDPVHVLSRQPRQYVVETAEFRSIATLEPPGGAFGTGNQLSTNTKLTIDKPPMESSLSVDHNLIPLSLSTPWSDPAILQTIPSLPMFYPTDSMHTLAMAEFPNTLHNLQQYFQNLSIEAVLEKTPIRANLKTREGILLHVVFWKHSQDPSLLWMDLQRLDGDGIRAREYMECLVHAAKGDDVACSERVLLGGSGSSTTTMVPDEPPSPDVQAALETLLSVAMEEQSTTWVHPPTPVPSLDTLCETIDRLLRSSRLDMLREGLEYLVQSTCKGGQTLYHDPSMRLAVGRGVLTGSPAAGSSQEENKREEWTFIHQSVLGLVRNHKKNDMKNLCLPALVQLAKQKDALPQNVVTDFMQEMHQLALQILEQSLEAAAAAASTNLETLRIPNSLDICQCLLSLLANDCGPQPRTAALACSSLESLAILDGTCLLALRTTPEAPRWVGTAVQVGRHQHAQLETASRSLWKVLYVNVQ